MIVIRCDPVSNLTPSVRDALKASGVPYVLEMWSTSGFFCPFCTKHLGAVPFAERKQRPCPRCFGIIWCRTLENGVLVVSSDDPETRWGK